MYPKYPLKEVQGVDTDKFPHAELMAIWDEFSNVLPLVPKRRYGQGSRSKTPHWDFWSKGSKYRSSEEEGAVVQIPDRAIAESYQQRDDVSGWCVVTGQDVRVLVVDLDPSEMDEVPETVYERIQGMSPTNFVLQTPSNGLHMYYRVPEDREIPKNTASKLIKGLDTRGVGGQVVFIGGINHYEEGKAEKKGVPVGHRATYTKIPYGIYDEVPEMTEALYTFLTQEDKEATPKEKREAAKNYAMTEAGMKRLKAHFNQPVTERDRVVAEAVQAVLKNWGGTRAYDDWVQVWMSAHHGSNGSTAIRDIFLSHPEVHWKDEEDIQDFIQKWDMHEWREDGYTVASLFWLARQEGWMSKTGYEIEERRMKHIDVKYVSEWVDGLETIPERLLLLSQTGSGKTYNIKNLYERLGQPKTVIFVPTRKLATELAMTLQNEHGLPVTLYRDNQSSEIIAREELAHAQVLVSTLQTFATKVDVPMEQYGLVYVEESDQLLAQFSRGGGGWNSSHVDDNQARRGFAKIREALNKSGVVWFVDATMSKVSQTVAEQMYIGHIEIVKNTRISDKAPVVFLPEKGLAYQKVLEGLVSGKRVVVCTDTAREAETVQEVMEQVGALRDKKSIVITRHTENRNAVKNFMEDVNYWSGQYDLVCYNSVMASGVSITATRPDIVVQISTYLSPRVNLQILNRYRKQNRVYVFYTNRENLYARSAEQVTEDVQAKAVLESILINMPIAKRLPDAELRAVVAAISIADTQRQFRAPKDFYADLLKEDGRRVTYMERETIYGKLEHAIDEVKEIRKAQKALISATWMEVEPIDEYNPAKPEYTSLQVAQGETHAFIKKALRGNIPEGVDPVEIYEIVDHFAKYGFILTAFIKQQLALKRSEYYLADNGRSLLNLTNNVTLIRLMKDISKLFHHSGEVLSPEMVKERADDFMEAITLSKDSYDNVIIPVTQKFDAVYEKNETQSARALAFAKILLAKVGLKLRSKKVRNGDKTEYHQHIANIEDARKFLLWRNAEDEQFNANIQFDDAPIVQAVEGRAEAYRMYSELTEEQQAKVFSLVDERNSFEVAVEVIKEGGSIVW